MRLSEKTRCFVVCILVFLVTINNAQILISDDPVIPSTTTTTTTLRTMTTTKASVITTTTEASIITTTTTVAPPPQVSSTTTIASTTLSTLRPSSSSIALPSSSAIIPSSSTSSSIAPITTSAITSSSSIVPSLTSSLTSATSSSSTSPSPTMPAKSNDTNNTPIIIGSVVGGVVGLALIGGLIACINRRGGCTKRTEKKNDLEDYGLGDFPHQRTSGPAPPMVMNNNKPVSPTLPRLNEQGNYYQDDAYGYSNHHGVHYVDNNMDYGMQPQQQHYYYPQQEYYDDGGYYYDSNTSGTAYSPQAPMQHNSSPMHSGVVAGQQYMMNNSNVPTLPQHNVYKPDEAGKALH